ncbi:zinc ribbon domain-containing protein [Micromonospora echinofusca]|uniref:Recombinase zinc beta ribbon domain-containing protein n=1 Tax=Micromonospora echinofusca TaxID=47858 RepID=A0ABS3VWA7_MICEH|nr:zinc ribbon domain-containing protein [Micromonospora echinofusca]MBO4208831.1 hypothetical protein [Micromonospora echinofusca]
MRRGTDSSTTPGSWWDSPGLPTPYLLWGLIWCGCGMPMVPLDRPTGAVGVGRYYRCDGGCGRRPVPAVGVETEVVRTVADTVLRGLPRYAPLAWRTRRVARPHADPDRRRDLVRRWLHRIVADAGRPLQLHWHRPERTGPGRDGGTGRP